MVSKITLLILSVLLLCPCQLRAETQDTYEALLDKARLEWQNGNTSEALNYYRQIPFGSPSWSHKLEDSLRLHLQKRQAEEAFRLAELALRTEQNIEHLDYYRALAATLGGVCTLPWNVVRKDWQQLLAAHIFRFANRFQQSSFENEAYNFAERGQIKNHLPKSMIHYLLDIPKIKLQPRQGCRFHQALLESNEAARASEFQALKAWYRRHISDESPLPGSLLVVSRLVELVAKNQEEEGLYMDLLEHFAALPLQNWQQIPEPDRSFLWQKLVETKLRPQGPFGPKDRHFDFIMGIILASHEAEAFNWAGLLAWDQLRQQQKQALIDHLITIESPDYQPFLLYSQAEIFYRTGDIPKALPIIRELLLLGKSQGKADIEQKALALAASIYGEFYYDKRLLGAIQSSIPGNKWREILRNVLLEQSLAGNQQGMALVMQLSRQMKGSQSALFSPEQINFLQALAQRRYNQMKKAMEKLLPEKKRLRAAQISFFSILAAQVTKLSDKEKELLKPYLDLLALSLQNSLPQSAYLQKDIQELIHVFDYQKSTQWSQGSELVRRGTVQAGSVYLESLPLSSPFIWQAPRQLPLRPLIVIPAGIANRDWRVE